MEYRLYTLDEKLLIISARNVMAKDDLDILEEARRSCDYHAVEIWQGVRRVARVKKGNAPLDIFDTMSQ